MKLKIDGRGDVKAVYSDVLPKLNLGDMEIKRASNVEFNEKAQQWEARVPENNELIASGTFRDQVIREEVRVIESRL